MWLWVKLFNLSGIMQNIIKQKNVILVSTAILIGFFVLSFFILGSSKTEPLSPVKVMSSSDLPPANVGLASSGAPVIEETSMDLGHELGNLGAVESGGYLAHIQLNSPEELKGALERAEKLYENGSITNQDNPVAFVLHGPEVSVFLKQNYDSYRPLVDLAAKLTALDVIDVKVCRTRLGMMSQTESDLAPFVGTVPFGPAEVSRLMDDEQYIYF